MRPFLLTCLLPALACGQPAITPPRVGLIQDSNHSLRAVLGVAANFLLSGSLREGVISSAFSGSFAMVKTDTSIMILDREGAQVYNMDVDAGPALFAFSDEGAPALVYLPQSQTLLQWTTGHLEAASLPADQIGGVIRSVASRGLVVQRDDGIWIVDLAGASQFLMAALDGPVLLRNDGSVLYATVDGFVLRRPNGTEQVLGGTGLQPARLLFDQMSRDWVHVTEAHSPRHQAIRLTPGQEQTYQLPEAQQ